VLLIPKRHRQTDGRTDRQTDGRLTVALPRSALASRGKNCSLYLTVTYAVTYTSKGAKIIKRWYYSAAHWHALRRRDDGLSPFYDFCCFRCMSHCMSPLRCV